MPGRGPRALLAACSILFTVSVQSLPGMGFGAGAGIAAAQESAEASVPSESMELTMPVKDNNFKLGDVIVQAGADGSIVIQRESFLIAIQSILREAAREALEDALPKKEYVTLSEITEASLIISYNPNDLELNVEPKVEQRPRGEIAGVARGGAASEDTVLPAQLSGYLNSHIGVAYERGANTANLEIPAIFFDGAARGFGVVLEGEGKLQIDGTIARKGTRVIYDMPDNALRITGGDLALNPSGAFSVPALLGVAIEKTYAELQPSRNVRPTGRRSFRVERHSEVRVIINGHEARRLQLAPGEYDLKDLPLTSGTNDIRLNIKDELGKEETVDFSVLYNRALLAPDIDEWSFAAGILTAQGPQDLEYNQAAPMVTGYYRRGVREDLTVSVSTQASSKIILFGTGALSQTPLGLWSFDAAVASHATGEFGWALSSELDLDTDALWDEITSAQFEVQVAGKDYASSLSHASADGTRIRISGGFSHRLIDGITASIGGYYQISDESADRGYGANFSINRVVGHDLTMGLSGNYEQRSKTTLDGYGNLSVVARLNYRPTIDSFIAFEHDQETRSSSTSVGKSLRRGAWQASIEANLDHGGSNDRHGSLGSIDAYYANSRIELNATHQRTFEGLTSLRQRTAVNAGIGFAFADENFAIGRPVRGGYAIVDVHETLKESTILIDPTTDYYRAASDGIGPLLVSNISSYTRTALPYDAENLPPGYDLGTGTLDFVSPYKAGHNVRIGSGGVITVVGLLLDHEKKPLVLHAGKVSPVTDPAKEAIVFTNAAGKFTARDLKPGRWMININGDTPLSYEFDISEDASGLIDIGNLGPKI